MPTTPHPAHHPDSNKGLTSTERKEITINTNSTDPHSDTDHGDDPANAPERDEAHCPCGALADQKGLCRKCRARATWQRRQANRGRRFTQRPPSSRRTDRDSSRPHGRRPGR
jgi:hypothetical protein